MSFLPFRNRAGLLAGIYIVNAITATFVVKLQWTASNVAGHNKRSASVALIAGSFSFGNIFGPQNFQAKDAPQYTSQNNRAGDSAFLLWYTSYAT